MEKELNKEKNRGSVLNASRDNCEQRDVFASTQHKHKNYVFDLMGVFFKVDKDGLREEERKLNIRFETISTHPAWTAWYKGHISREEAYSRISRDTLYPVESIDALIEKAKNSLIINEDAVTALRDLKSQGKKLYCLTNSPSESITYLRDKYPFFDNFDIVFASGNIGLSKPDPKVYEYVFKFANLSPEETLYMDDNETNVKVANHLGIETILFKFNTVKNTAVPLIKTKEKVVFPSVIGGDFSDRLLRAYHYLATENIDEYGLYRFMIGKTEKLLDAKPSPYSGQFDSAIVLNMVKPLAFHKTGHNMLKIFSSNLTTDGLSPFLVNLRSYPMEIDTTVMIISLLHRHGLVNTQTVHKAIDRIISNMNQEGLLLGFFDKNKPRLDAIMSANALHLAYSFGRGDDPAFDKTKDYIFKYVTHNVGGYYYYSRDLSLLFITRLIRAFPQCFNHPNAYEILSQQVKSRIGTTAFAGDLAFRVIACHLLGIPNTQDYRQLLSLQKSDGSWPPSSVYYTVSQKNTFGGADIHLANPSVNTAFGLKALELKMLDSNPQTETSTSAKL